MVMTGTRVVGLDLGVTDGVSADAIASQLASQARAQGASAARLVVGVHRVLGAGPADPTLPGTGHLALSLRADDLDDEQVWAVASKVAARVLGEQPDRGALVLGRRRSGPRPLQRCAEAAAREQTDRLAGRAVAFPGDGLVGAVQVGDLTSGTVIDEVLDLAGSGPRADDLVLLAGRARPRWQFGSLVLHVLPAPGAGDGAVYVPVETMRTGPVASEAGPAA